MAVGDLCRVCGRYSSGLISCQACGSRVCPGCVDPKTGYCKLCGGIRRIK